MVNPANHNVIGIIKDNDICVGCGVCVSSCPQNHLAINFDKFGKYSIFETKNPCMLDCNICLNICAFSKSNKNDWPKPAREPEFNSLTGYYTELFVGHVNSKSMRIKSSSGGITRFLLAKLLEKKLVDFVVHVVPNFSDPDKLFKYSVSSKIDDVLNTSPSAYYPVELSDCLNIIKKTEGKYAIVALPCFVNSLRNQQKVDRIFSNRVKYLFSLICGQNKTKFFTEYIFSLAGGSKKDRINRVIFRQKYPDKNALDYTYSYLSNGNKREISFLAGINKIWNNQLFTINSCNYCNDIFGAKADISLMDAWLPKYIKDWKGNNIVISRNDVLDRLLLEFKENDELILSKISLEDVILSQYYAINKKRKTLGWRLSRSKHNYTNSSYKKITPRKAHIFDKDYLLMRTQDYTNKLTLLYGNKKTFFINFRIAIYINILNIITMYCKNNIFIFTIFKKIHHVFHKK